MANVAFGCNLDLRFSQMLVLNMGRPLPLFFTGRMPLLMSVQQCQLRSIDQTLCGQLCPYAVCSLWHIYNEINFVICVNLDLSVTVMLLYMLLVISPPDNIMCGMFIIKLMEIKYNKCKIHNVFLNCLFDGKLWMLCKNWYCVISTVDFVHFLQLLERWHISLSSLVWSLKLATVGSLEQEL